MKNSHAPHFSPPQCQFRSDEPEVYEIFGNEMPPPQFLVLPFPRLDNNNNMASIQFNETRERVPVHHWWQWQWRGSLSRSAEFPSFQVHSKWLTYQRMQLRVSLSFIQIIPHSESEWAFIYPVSSVSY